MSWIKLSKVIRYESCGPPRKPKSEQVKNRPPSFLVVWSTTTKAKRCSGRWPVMIVQTLVTSPVWACPEAVRWASLQPMKGVGCKCRGPQDRKSTRASLIISRRVRKALHALNQEMCLKNWHWCCALSRSHTYTHTDTHTHTELLTAYLSLRFEFYFTR